MAFSESELAAHKKEMDGYMAWRRPADALRDMLDLSYRIEGHSIVILSIRPHWQDASVILESSVAKAPLVRTRGDWRVFWQRASLEWQTFPDSPRVKSLSEFLALVEADERGCFWE